ncbi:MAG: response regulator [Pseudomonadota bacterium]
MTNIDHPIVLFVDDDETDLLLVGRIAKKLGFDNRIRTVDDPDDALALLSRLPSRFGTPPAVLVTDINMPSMSGHELIDKIRSADQLCNLPIFVLSTSDLQSDFERAYRSKVAGYIVKDTSGQRMSECVAMIMHYSRAVEFPASH